MSNSKGFTKNVGPIGSTTAENYSTHQCSPTWVVTFVRWAIRDTLNTTGDGNAVENQLVVENDCVAVSTADSKGTLTPTVTITLLETDVNYATAVAPGDFIFVNMLNWEEDSRRVADAARNGTSINNEKDGFKGVYKVQSVRKTISVDPSSGSKRVMYKVTGFAFTEFNNTIYFNPYLLDKRAGENGLLFASHIGNDWHRLINAKGLTNIQDIMRALIDSFIGSGINDLGRTDKADNIKSPNVHFFLPQLVGNLMGVTGATAAKDLFNYIFGIQHYAAGESEDLALGMNPTGFESSGRFHVGTPVQGSCLAKPEYWNQVKTWAILNQFTNAPLNELYTTFKIAPNGSVMPTVVFRQTPFTSESYSGGENVTHFMNLPRWKISPTLITDTDIGRDEAARINFVQMFGRSAVNANDGAIAAEIAEGNYVYDIEDVQRSGLRPYIINTNFDEATPNLKSFRSPGWAKILGDSVIGNHLKLNGTINCFGIVDPIAVGDNLEFDGIIFHIESVSHQCAIEPTTGRKHFRTSVGLSSGVLNTDKNILRYGEMANTGGYEDRDRDSDNLQILPGVSESQDTFYRKESLDLPTSPSGSFVQPNGKAQFSAKPKKEDTKK